MNALEPSNAVYLAGFVVFFATRAVFARRADREAKVVDRVDPTEKTLLALVAAGNLLVPSLHLFTPWLSFADYRLPAWAPWTGGAVMVASLWLFWRSHADLGLNWSVSLQVREGHELVRRGVFASIRHPMYASIWLWGIAQALMLGNWLAGPGTLAPFALMYFVRVPREERLMRDTFGDAYRAYEHSTGRLLPRLGRARSRAPEPAATIPPPLDERPARSGNEESPSGQGRAHRRRV